MRLLVARAESRYNRSTGEPEAMSLFDDPRESDLFFRLPFLPDAEGDQEPPALVCLLLEHQSQPERWMPLRVLLYAVLYWRENRRRTITRCSMNCFRHWSP
jgi:hypothetical protein